MSSHPLVRGHASFTNESGWTSLALDPEILCMTPGMGCQVLSACCLLSTLGTKAGRSPLESWQSCTVKAGQPVLCFFFLLLSHETAQTKYALYTKSFGDELNLHLENIHAHYCFFFFFVQTTQKCICDARVLLFAPKLASLGELRYTKIWHYSCVRHNSRRCSLEAGKNYGCQKHKPVNWTANTKLVHCDFLTFICMVQTKECLS